MCIRLKVELTVTRRSLIICRDPTQHTTPRLAKKNQHKSPEISHGAGGLHGPELKTNCAWDEKSRQQTQQAIRRGLGWNPGQDLRDEEEEVVGGCGLFTMSLYLDKGISLFWFGFNFEQRIN